MASSPLAVLLATGVLHQAMEAPNRTSCAGCGDHVTQSDCEPPSIHHGRCRYRTEEEWIVNHRMERTRMVRYAVQRIGLCAVTLLVVVSSSLGDWSSRQAAAQSPQDSAGSAAPTTPAGVDAAAPTFAHQVRGGGGIGRTQLVEALRLSGFRILGADGAEMAHPVGMGQGVSFAAWEVDVLAARDSTGPYVSLSNLGETLAAGAPDLTGAPIADLLLDEVRASVNSSQLDMRFWARFVVELGRTASEPYDLLGAPDPSAVLLDGTQVQLLVRHSVISAWLAGHQSQSVAMLDGQVANSDSVASNTWTAAALQASSLPCTLTEQDRALLDGAVKTTKISGSYLRDWLAKQHIHWSADRWFEYGGTLLTYAKLAINKLAFKIDLDLVGGSPLVRTPLSRITDSGAHRRLKAAVRFDIGANQAVNCFRIMLAPLGLDLDVPNDGPLEGAQVTFKIVDGRDLVRFFSLYGRIQDGTNETYGNRADLVRTDKEGIAYTGLEGLPQQSALPHDIVPVAKTVVLVVQAAPKHANIVQDLLDALDVLEVGVNPAVLVTAVPVEMALREPALFEFPKAIEVTDWKARESCDAVASTPPPTEIEFDDTQGEEFVAPVIFPDAEGESFGGEQAKQSQCKRGWTGVVTIKNAGFTEKWVISPGQTVVTHTEKLRDRACTAILTLAGTPEDVGVGPNPFFGADVAEDGSFRMGTALARTAGFPTDCTDQGQPETVVMYGPDLTQAEAPQYAPGATSVSGSYVRGACDAHGKVCVKLEWSLSR
jgi:hypothetical protein